MYLKVSGFRVEKFRAGKALSEFYTLPAPYAPTHSSTGKSPHKAQLQNPKLRGTDVLATMPRGQALLQPAGQTRPLAERISQPAGAGPERVAAFIAAEQSTWQCPAPLSSALCWATEPIPSSLL